MNVYHMFNMCLITDCNTQHVMLLCPIGTSGGH